MRVLIVVWCSLLVAGCGRDPGEAGRRALARGDRYVAQGRNDAALIEYRNAVRDAPGLAAAHVKLGETLDTLGRRSEARAAFIAASRIVDGQPLPLREDDLRAVVARTPSSAAARVALADQLLSRRETAEAEEQLRAATALDPANELAHRSLAAIYLATDRSDEAERHLVLAARIEPQRYGSSLALADFLMESGRVAEARPILESLQRTGRSDDIALRIAAVDDAEGAAERARRTVADLIAARPSAGAWTLQATFQLRDGLLEDALASAREALAIDPTFLPAEDVANVVRGRQLGR
jgi:tetratricopeptide (TPR) repeat protein